jgi:hypothetical protein
MICEVERASFRLLGARQRTLGAGGLPGPLFPMHPSLSRTAYLWCALIVLLLSSWPGSAGQQSDTSGDEAVVLFLPARREADPPPAGPPELPPGAEQVTPVTVEGLIRRQPLEGGAQTVRQTITRSADRVHVAASAGREWLFERNVRDPRRVFGWAIDHASRVIVVYDESDLRTVLGLHGWASVFTMGFDLESLAGLKRSGQSRTIEGIAFTHYAADRENAAIREVWWSDDQIFPCEFVTADAAGSTRFTVESVRVGVDATLLQAPPSRFPTYRIFELAEWLERH